jgi:hypothetical protein
MADADADLLWEKNTAKWWDKFKRTGWLIVSYINYLRKSSKKRYNGAPDIEKECEYI